MVCEPFLEIRGLVFDGDANGDILLLVGLGTWPYLVHKGQGGPIGAFEGRMKLTADDEWTGSGLCCHARFISLSFPSKLGDLNSD